MIQQEQERVITHHTVTLGPLTREGDAQVELVQQDADGSPQVPAEGDHG